MKPHTTPTQDRVAFASKREGAWGIYIRDLRTDKEEVLFRSPAKTMRVTDWSPDGRYLIYEAEIDNADRNVYALEVGKDHKPIPVAQSRELAGRG